MKATDFEFRNRFWIFGLIFGVGFWLYAFDHVNIVQYLVNITVGANSPHADLLARCGLAFAALLMLLTALLRTWATSYLRSDVMQDHALHAEKVVASGPYRHVRNPLYLGNILMAIGMGLLGEPLGIRGDRRGKYCFLPALDRPGRIQSAKRARRILHRILPPRAPPIAVAPAAPARQRPEASLGTSLPR